MKKIIIYLSLIPTLVNTQSPLKTGHVTPLPRITPHITPSTLEIPYCAFSFIDVFSAIPSTPEKSHYILSAIKNNPVPAAYQQYLQFVEERLDSYNPTYNLPVKQNMVFNPLDLISWWRFDIIVKYIYAFHYEHNIKSNWAHELYTALLYAWGGAQEWDNSRNNMQEYLDRFHTVIESIKTSGFDPHTSRIRIDNRKFPCEGAHRVATALLYNKPVVCYYDPDPYLNSACQATGIFFREFDKYVPTGLDEKYLDAMALQYCTLKADTRMITVVSRDNHDYQKIQQILRLHGNVVYHKTCTITDSGIHYILNPDNYWPAADQPKKSQPTENQQSNFHQTNCTPNNMLAHMTVFLFEPRQIDNISMLPNLLHNHFSDQPYRFFACCDHLNSIALAQTFFVSNSLNIINNEQLWLSNQLQQHEPALTLLNKLLENCTANNPFKNSSSNSLNNIDNSSDQSLDSLDKSFLCIDFNDTLPHQQRNPAHQPVLTIHYHGKIPTPQSPQFNFICTAESDDIIFNPSRHFYHKGIKYALPTI